MTKRSVDWAALIAQVNAPAAAPVNDRAQLEERARRLARPAESARTVATLEVVTFGLSRGRFALPTRLVLEALRLMAFTPIPRTPDFVLGVTNLRGGILPILDLRRALGVAASGITDLSRLLVLGREEAEFALVVDRVNEVVTLELPSLVKAELVDRGAGNLVQGITPDGISVLDGDALLDDPRFMVAAPGADGLEPKERAR